MLCYEVYPISEDLTGDALLLTCQQCGRQHPHIVCYKKQTGGRTIVRCSFVATRCSQPVTFFVLASLPNLSVSGSRLMCHGCCVRLQHSILRDHTSNAG